MTILKPSQAPKLAAIVATSAVLSFSNPGLATKDTKDNINEPDQIIVTGQKTETEIIQQLITNQFNLSGGGKQTGQYARFASPICPSVGGLQKEQAALVEDRIRDIAEVAELLVAPDNCTANLFVVAVDNGADEIKALRKKRGRLFTSLSYSKRDKLVDGGGPIYSWKSTQRMASDSRHSARAGNYMIISDSLGPITATGQRSHVKSKIHLSEFAGISYSYLFIENHILSKVSLNPLADYAAVASLLDIDLNFDSAPPPPNSILSLFSDQQSGQSPPQSISEGDLLMVRGLYKVPANVKAPLQKSAMLHTIDKALESDNEPEQ